MANKIAFGIITLEVILIATLLAGGLGIFVSRYATSRTGEAMVTVGAVRTLPLTTSPRLSTPQGSVPATTAPIPLPRLDSVPSPTSTALVTSTPSPVPWIGISDCGTIQQPGTFIVEKDLTVNGDCLTIKTSGATLDCMGHSIQGSNRTGYGIAVRKYGLLGEMVPQDIVIRNCNVSRFFYGIYVESANRLSIHDNVSSDNYDDAELGSRYGKFLGMTEGGGIRLNYVSDSDIFDNITSREAIGIDIQRSSGVRVRGNTASGNSAWGINLQRTRDSEAIENTVTDNIRQCTWGAGVIGEGCDAGGIILQDESSNNLVARNRVTGRNGNGIFIKAHALPCGNDNHIISNTISSALYNSVELGFCSGNKVNNNVMRDSMDGVMLIFSREAEVKDNTIENMKNHGIVSPNSHHITVSGNQITNSNEGVFFLTEGYDRNFFSWLPEGDYASHDNCLCGNTFRLNATAVRIKDSSYNRIVANTFEENRQRIVIQGRTVGNDTNGNYGSIPRDETWALSRARGLPLGWGLKGLSFH